MWPKLLDMSKDECKRLLRRTELEAYAGVISAFRAQGDITKDKKLILNELAACLSISTERHRAEVRRAVNDEKLSTVAERLSGANNSAEWSIEGRRLIPLMPRLVPQTVFSLTANQAANAAFSHNLTLPLPSETAKKEVPCGSENNGGSVRLASPSSSVVVLPSVLSIPTKGSPDGDTEGPPTKRSCHDSNNSHPKDTGTSLVASHTSSSLPSNLLNVSTKPSTAHAMTTNRSMSVPASKHHSGYTIPVSKQHVGKPVVSRMSPGGQSMTSAAIKASLASGQSPLKFTYTKASKSAGITTPTCSAQKVILVSNSATSFTPSILQRSHSAPSPKSPQGKPGSKQSVILTSVSGQSSVSRQAEVVSSGKHTSPSQRQHATTSTPSSNRQTVSGRQQEMTSGQMIPPDSMQGAMTGVMTGGKRQSLNTGISTMNSTFITARTTASVITSQMTTYVSTNMAGKPRGRAVSKQKLLKQVNATPVGGASTLASGESTALKKVPGIRGQQDAGMKIISQTLATSSNKQQRSSSQTTTTEASHKAAMATATVATGKPANVMAGHKVIISTTSAGVAPQHVAMATPLIRTKPSGTMGSMGTVASKMMTSGALNVGGVTKIVPSGTMGSTGVNSPKMMQTIKATTTANVGQTVTGVTQIINSKPSSVMHKTLSSSAQGGSAEASKPIQAHNIASSLLQRPRISMVTGGVTSPVTSNFPSSSIRFPSPQNTSSITMTTVKSSGSKRMRSPVTMVTGTVPSVQQRRQVAPSSQNPLHGTVITGTSEELPTGKQVKDNSRSLTRGLLGSCSHPNSEWIDYDGHCPDSSASSAIKALLEFRSHPDAAKHSQTIDLSHIGTSSTAKPVVMTTQAATVCTTAPSKLSQHALLTSRMSHPPSEHPAVGSQLEGLSNYPPALLSNMQSRLKQALMTDRTVKPAAAASFLQTATMEVEKALQEQNKALLAKHEGSVKLTGPKSSQDGGSKLSGPSELTAPPKKVQTEIIKPQQVTVEDQGVVVGKVNVSSEDVSSFVDQFEKFLESEGTIGGQKQIDRSSESIHAGHSVGSFQLPTRMATTKPTAGPPEGISASDWTVASSSQRVGTELIIPSWKNKPGLETIVTPGKKGAASVVMVSGSIDITQMKIEDFTSQRLQDADDLEEDKDASTTSPESSPVKVMGESPGTAASTVSASGSEELQSVRISNRKRKAPAPIDEEPGPTSMSSWARAAFNLLQRVMRFRGANRSKGDLNAASWFTRPVAAAEAPGYNRVIKNPMDFGTIKRKLESGQYDDFACFHSDMMLVHSNCMQYNPPGHEIRRDCDEVFQFYTSEYAKLIERWERQPSPKKPKSEDLHGDRAKPAAARSIMMK